MEYLDIIDVDNNVIGNAPKGDIYAKKLPHRIVHVWLFNDAGELALQMQSAIKKFKPLHWCSTAAGHVQSGESLLEAGQRELLEECEVAVPLTLSQTVWYEGADAPGLRKVIGLCEGVYTKPLAVNNIEVTKVDFFPVSKIREMIAHGEKMHPELVFLFQQRYSSKT